MTKAYSGMSRKPIKSLLLRGVNVTALVAGLVDRLEADGIKARIKRALGERFGIGHVTLEMECASHACDDAEAIGHG